MTAKGTWDACSGLVAQLLAADPPDWESYHDAASTGHARAWFPLMLITGIIAWGCAAIAVWEVWG